VSVTMFGQKRTCMLPVMDHRNKPIPKPDAFQVNTSIMRCMVKALALHGLGLHIYAGEDVPETVDQDTGEIKQARKPEPKPEPKQEKPVDAAGKPGKWQISVKVDPKAEPKDYVNIVSEAAVAALSVAETKDDVMNIFKVNRTVFDQMKKLDEDNYNDLLDAFKATKEKLP